MEGAEYNDYTDICHSDKSLGGWNLTISAIMAAEEKSGEEMMARGPIE